MEETLSRKAMRAGRVKTIVRGVMLALLLPVWCVAVIAHLYCLRRGTLDVCCVDD